MWQRRTGAGGVRFCTARQPCRGTTGVDRCGTRGGRQSGSEATLMLRVYVKRIGGTLRAPAGQLLEVVTPRTNAALISPAEHLCAGLSLHAGAPGGGPVAL